MYRVRIGIVGIGGMGAQHAAQIREGKVPRAELTAVCDASGGAKEKFPDVAFFQTAGELIRSGRADALIIATPHFSHLPIGVDALQHGLHVLVEKPIAVHKADCEKFLATPRKQGQVFAAMFNQRTDPYFQLLRDLIQTGELGEVRRINWTVTNWYRTNAYYKMNDWRATWSGEGGGVLLNQCPHNLDIWQWLFGMPKTVRALCALGRYHDIEVEDDVTALLEYENGTTGVFITSTGEAPGTNRLEVAAERGKVVIENDVFKFTRNEIPMSEFSATSPLKYDPPPSKEITVPMPGHGEQHLGIMKNFVEAIVEGVPLLAPAEEGIHSIELGNAMLLSSIYGRPVDLPMDSAAYEAELNKKIAASV